MPPPTRPACHRNGGPLCVGMAARFTSERGPTLRWNAGPLRIGLPGPLRSEFAASCSGRKLNGRDEEVSEYRPRALPSAPTGSSDVEVPAFDLGKQGVSIKLAWLSRGPLVAFNKLLI